MTQSDDSAVRKALKGMPKADRTLDIIRRYRAGVFDPVLQERQSIGVLVETIERFAQIASPEVPAAVDEITPREKHLLRALTFEDLSATLQRLKACAREAVVMRETIAIIEHEASLASHMAMTWRNQPCRDRRDEEDYERHARECDREKDTLKRLASLVRAKSHPGKGGRTW